jgi:WD40 repeat protein
MSPDERLVAISPIHATMLIIFDFATGAELFQIDIRPDHPYSIWHYSWSPNGSKLFILSREGVIRVWDAQNSSEVFTGQHGSGVLQAAWSPNGEFIFSTSRDGSVVLWDVELKEAVFTRLLPRPLRGFRWHPDATRLLVWSEDLLEIWDFTQAELVAPSVPEWMQQLRPKV